MDGISQALDSQFKKMGAKKGGSERKNSAINIMVKFLISDDLSHQPSLKEESFLHQWKGFSTTHSPKIRTPAKA